MIRQGGFNDADITPQSSFRQQMSAPSPVKEEAVVDDDDALSYFANLRRTDMDVVHAWNSMSYGEGFLFSLWVIGMYYIKLRMDRYFTR